MFESRTVYLHLWLWNYSSTRFFFSIYTKEQFGKTCPKVNKRKLKKGGIPVRLLMSPPHPHIFPLSLLNWHGQNSLRCLYKLHIFHLLVPSSQLKIVPPFWTCLIFYICLFSMCHCAESFLTGRAAVRRRMAWDIVFFNPLSNGVIVIKTFQPLF